MSKSYRIRTTPGQENNGFINVNVDLNQNYDQLEILSLKISQKDDYQNFCADYGVVAGRIIVNNGFGVPNVKVSIFVPVDDADLADPVKSSIYPYTEPFPDQKNSNGVRYNVLPKNQQSFDHTPVGTFPKKREVLDDNTTLEIYEKYYKYTTVTNEAGDYILFGIPVGDHFLHYDMDVSDIGFISIRPFEMIDKDGYSDDLFDSRFKYKGSNNLDSLPQIFSENIPITVEPYWCDSLSVGSGLGINRYDIEPNISITPTAIFMGSIFSDDEKDSLNKNCKPSREMGKLNEVVTGPGKIEAIRRTVDGNIETFEFNDNSIDDNGNWSVLVPMNIRKVVTDEFGNLVPSPDGIKGIATEGDYRFRVSMDATSNDKRLRQRAKFLVPNTNNNFNFGEFSTKQLKKQRPFTLNEQLSTITDETQYKEDITNQYNYLEEFFPFRWKKVYTVKQYIGRFQKSGDFLSSLGLGLGGDESRGFIGIKDIINAEGVNKFPTNRTDTTINPLYTIICILVVLFGHIVGFINGIIQFINGLLTLICDIQIPTGICAYSIKGYGVDTKFNAQVNLERLNRTSREGDPTTWYTLQYDADEGGQFIDKEYKNDVQKSDNGTNDAGRPWIEAPGCFDTKDICDVKCNTCKTECTDCYNNTSGARGSIFSNPDGYDSVDYIARKKVNGKEPIYANVAGVPFVSPPIPSYYFVRKGKIGSFFTPGVGDDGFKPLKGYANLAITDGTSDNNDDYVSDGLHIYAPYRSVDDSVPGWVAGQDLPPGITNDNGGGTKTLEDQNPSYYSGPEYSDGYYIFNQYATIIKGSKAYENVVLRTFFYSNVAPDKNWYKQPSAGGDNCGSCKLSDCQEGELRIFSSCWALRKSCLFSPGLCSQCKEPCSGEGFSCCSNDAFGCPSNSSTCGGIDGGCCQDRCCQRVGLIPLKCNDEGVDLKISLINLQNFSPACNVTYVKTNACANCGGRQTPGIKDWASCILEPVAVFLRMLKFDFYNDWVGGTLYFPLVKRKYKLKKNKRKFGQIKKDKFCDFDCKERVRFEENQFGIPVPVFSENFQGNPTFKQHRIRITPTLTNLFPTITVGGCTARVLLRRATDWYGTEENDLEIPNLDLAVQDLEFNGRNSNNERCKVIFNNFGEFQTEMNASGIAFTTPERDIQTKHGKPEYVETEDANGTSTWENIGGHAHHRNICDDTRLLERKEYFKTSLDCLSSGCNRGGDPIINNDDNPLGDFGKESGDEDNKCWDPWQPQDYCELLTCDPDCGSNGVAPCIEDTIEEYNDYGKVVKHGLISWNDEEIYYTPYIPPQDPSYNDVEYKANLMLPTTIMELGSSVYCDIDDIPFVMDVLPPTTFNASYEDIKYKFGDSNNNYSGPNGVLGDDDDGILREITKFDDKKDISLNLRAYVEFACSKVICENITAPVVQSQLGVDIIDKNDLGIEIGNCFVRFDHEDEVRDYFCRRFNGYKADNLSFHHQRPGSIQYENEYNTYQEITLTDGVNRYYQLPQGDIVYSEYNDGDSFIPGDGCGYRNTNGPTDFFYGVAPGQTSSFINYPNTDPYDGAGGPNITIDFGQTAQLDGTDEIFSGITNSEGDISLVDDINNGSVSINGIRFNRSQTPYYLYFGLVPGKTALHKTVGKFFADRIDAITLQGLGASPDSVDENINNTPNINNVQDNTFSVFRTCLGDTLIQPIKVGDVLLNNNTTGSGTQGNNNTGGSNPSTGGGTSTGGSVGTSGTGSSNTGGSNSPDYVLSYTDPSNGTFYPNVNEISILNGACATTTPTEIRNFTLEVNSLPSQLEISLWGGDGGSPDCFPPGPSDLVVNISFGEVGGSGGIQSYTVPVQSLPNPNQVVTIPIPNQGSFEGSIEIFPFYRTNFEVTLTVN